MDFILNQIMSNVPIVILFFTRVQEKVEEEDKNLLEEFLEYTGISVDIEKKILKAIKETR